MPLVGFGVKRTSRSPSTNASAERPGFQGSARAAASEIGEGVLSMGGIFRLCVPLHLLEGALRFASAKRNGGDSPSKRDFSFPLRCRLKSSPVALRAPPPPASGGG